MPGALVVVQMSAGAVEQAKQAGVDDLLRRANRVKNRAQTLAPVDTGVLRASINVSAPIKVGGDVEVRVGSGVKYALFVHEGTGLWGSGNLIRPRHGSVLRWPATNNSGSGRRRYKGGKTAAYVFSRYSKGSPPNHFLTDALPAAQG
jgi:hypothetical protein